MRALAGKPVGGVVAPLVVVARRTQARGHLRILLDALLDVSVGHCVDLADHALSLVSGTLVCGPWSSTYQSGDLGASWTRTARPRAEVRGGGLTSVPAWAKLSISVN